MKKNRVVNISSLLLVWALLFQAVTLLRAQQSDINDKIRREEMNSSQIMQTLHYLTDVYGARLTGSPNHKAAADWAAAQMKKWGFENVHLEPWDFGHPGWVNDRASGFITAPVQDSLVFEVLAWTPGTKGAVSGQAVSLIIPTYPAPTKVNPKATRRPTQGELNAYFESIKANIRGKMVLVGKPAIVPVNLNPPPKRYSDEFVKQILDPNSTALLSDNKPQSPTILPPGGPLTRDQVSEQLDKFLVDNGAAVRVNDAGLEHGEIRAFNNRTFDIAKNVPTVVLCNEDFSRIFRLMGDGTPVSLEFNIKNKIFPEGKTSYNVIGEIQGTDKKDEVIMMGAHLDSWHSATGATDNAVGCAIMMEAMRILKSAGLQPRRTIRIALWSGEEEGVLGSTAYIKEHFGSYENQKPDYSKFGGYFNIDSGTGRVRGWAVFGPPEDAAILRQIVDPFTDFGLLGATILNSRKIEGSDHSAFNNAGLPGIAAMQDPIEYESDTWHTNLDTYERIVEDDVKKNAIIVAYAAYQLAVRDELLPRYKAGEMPAPPAG